MPAILSCLGGLRDERSGVVRARSPASGSCDRLISAVVDDGRTAIGTFTKKVNSPPIDATRSGPSLRWDDADRTVCQQPGGPATHLAGSFTAGTEIAVPGGIRAVQDLRQGDLVETVDGGARPVIWVGGGPVRAGGDHLPIAIAAGVLGATRDLRVAGQTLILLRNRAVEQLFGEDEVLIAAADLVGLSGITREVTPQIMGYYHVLLSRHDLLIANGLPCHGLQQDPLVLKSLGVRVMAEPGATVVAARLAASAPQSVPRRTLQPHEARVLLAMLHDGDATARTLTLLGIAV